MTHYIVSATHKPERALMGGKACALATLSENFNIPDWFVVTSSAFLEVLKQNRIDAVSDWNGEVLILPDALKDEILRSVIQLNGKKDARFAVRSSATAEDGFEQSFAGQLESFLNVSYDDILSKIQAVWRSAFAEHVSRYHEKNKNLFPAVIVQNMVDAEVSGVGFSTDPVSRRLDRRVINVTEGLADKLVSGEVNGDTYHLDEQSHIIQEQLAGDSPILSDRQRVQVNLLISQVADFFDYPQDIEWAIADGNCYLLQARPITNLQNTLRLGRELTLWDNSNIVESYSGITSPLTFSFARYVYQHVYAEFGKIMGVSRQKIEREQNTLRNMLGYVNGHVYYNLLNWYRFLALFPGFAMNRGFMEQMMGVKEALSDDLVAGITSPPSRHERFADTLNFMRTLLGLVWQQLRLKRTSERFYQRLDKALSQTKAIEKLSLDELGQAYRKLEAQLLSKWDAPLINDFLCMIAFGLSRKQLEKMAGKDGLALHNDIMIGQGDIISAEPVKRMAAMATIIKNDEHSEKIIAKLQAADSSALAMNKELSQAFDDYLEKFGQRCLQELKLESPTLNDDASTLLIAIGHMVKRDELTKNTQKELLTIDAALQSLAPKHPIKRWWLSVLLRWAKNRVRDRENLRFERTRVFGRVRQIFVAIGQHLHAMDLLETPRDIFYLQAEEILGLIEGTSIDSNLKTQVASRKKQLEQYSQLSAPPNRFQTQGATIGKFSEQHFGQDCLDKINLDSNSAQGIGCCQGIVCGPVRVIDNPRDAKLHAGEIMVAQFTDPGWITLFANAAGILVERGSLLSHSAIVSREMGIPAIVAIDGVTSWLKTGDWVEMNGATGVVRKVEKTR